MKEFILDCEKVLQEYIPDLKLYSDSKWASTYTDHRLKIRKKIYNLTQIKSVLDLNQVPALDKMYVSISHCPVMGGFVMASKPIGFDLEQKQRLSPSILKRVCNYGEEEFLPEAGFKLVWTTKESVYKCNQKFSLNMVSVKFKNYEMISDNKSMMVLAINSEFDSKNYKTLSFMSKVEDLCLSISFFDN